MTGCTKNRSYRTVEAAEQAAVALGEKYSKTFWPYYCRIGCEMYHLTTSPPRKRRKKGKKERRKGRERRFILETWENEGGFIPPDACNF